ncbi:MAG: NTP transferase domain-containing protein [Candidatus Jordarchaeales archaeon]|nr:NTP transferase domain-containing protein [Candidatus Jordarchaeia archaeon]
MRKADGVIMAGGKGSRLGVGEKPLVRVKGRSMIDYVVAAMRQARLVRRVYAAVSPHTPKTAHHLEKTWRGSVWLIQTLGAGYVEDLRHVAATLRSPAMLVCPADMPLLRGDLLDFVVDSFFREGKPSLVVVVPHRMMVDLGLEPSFTMSVDGEEVVPSGVNVVNGVELASRETLEESYLKVGIKEFAVNVNTASCLEVAEKLLPLTRGTRSIGHLPMRKFMKL